MRTLSQHIVEGDSVNHQLTIAVADEPGHGGANHQYVISLKNADGEFEFNCCIGFQNGPIKEFGVNGVTQEALLAIVIDRLEGFQKGPFPSQDNVDALHHVKSALTYLQKRTRARIARGVEGTTAA